MPIPIMTCHLCKGIGPCMPFNISPYVCVCVRVWLAKVDWLNGIVIINTVYILLEILFLNLAGFIGNIRSCTCALLPVLSFEYAFLVITTGLAVLSRIWFNLAGFICNIYSCLSNMIVFFTSRQM